MSGRYRETEIDRPEGTGLTIRRVVRDESFWDLPWRWVLRWDHIAHRPRLERRAA